MSYAFAEPNRALIAALGCPRDVLDVGCGIGLNGAAARRRGARVVGIETDREAATLARARLHEVLEVDFTDRAALATHLGDRRFDTIVLGDVLEHVVDPQRALAGLLPHLDDGGRVLVSLTHALLAS